MDKQTFIVSDESLNTHGFVILTAGIDYADFARNPIMYYMHDRNKGVIGRWENIRVDGSNLLMDAVFDDSTAFGQQIKKQVENGFLRCASIGIDEPQMADINGVQTVVKCRLREVSIVDIPANRSAVKLFDKQGKEVWTLAEWTGYKADPLRRTIIAYLGLSDRAEDAEILEALEMRSNSPKMPENAVSRAIRLNLISKDDREEYMAMARANIQAFDELIARKEARAKARFEEVFLNAAREARVDATQRAVYEEVAQSGGYALCEKIISLIPKRITLQSIFESKELREGLPPRSEWGLNEYRKYAPEELQDDPELYMSLMERDGQHIPLTAESVDYYRKHNPEYLAKHPKEYARVMAERNVKR